MNDGSSSSPCEETDEGMPKGVFQASPSCSSAPLPSTSESIADRVDETTHTKRTTKTKRKSSSRQQPQPHGKKEHTQKDHRTAKKSHGPSSKRRSDRKRKHSQPSSSCSSSSSQSARSAEVNESSSPRSPATTPRAPTLHVAASLSSLSSAHSHDHELLGAEESYHVVPVVTSSLAIRRLDDVDLQLSEPTLKVLVGGRYAVGYTIGRGSFGKVKEGICTETRGRVAVKILKHSLLQKFPGGMESLRREIRICTGLRHKNVVQLLDTFEDEFKEKTYIVMELGLFGTLHALVDNAPAGRLPEAQAARLFQQILDALRYLHMHNIVHNDLKPANCLLFENGSVVKLADFGVASSIKGDSGADRSLEGDHADKRSSSRESTRRSSSRTERNGLKGRVKATHGTPAIQPPELASGVQSVPTPAYDVWAAGVCLYFMLSGTFPFTGTTVYQLLNIIAACEWVLPEGISPRAQRLLKKMLHSDPAQRISVSNTLKDRWLSISSFSSSSTQTLAGEKSLLASSTGTTPAVAEEANPSRLTKSSSRIQRTLRQLDSSSVSSTSAGPPEEFHNVPWAVPACLDTMFDEVDEQGLVCIDADLREKIHCSKTNGEHCHHRTEDFDSYTDELSNHNASSDEDERAGARRRRRSGHSKKGRRTGKRSSDGHLRNSRHSSMDHSTSSVSSVSSSESIDGAASKGRPPPVHHKKRASSSSCCV
eukprot:CAMPEP_0174239732 /NCGR_PEP_ID=MMETSP0417-20130205/15872_1 /TAXON_ID=242541 /ORGANISM="Mayorella sp, Strain BSH-02190019" /LENGTH=708 /DNA_ID=CAMNT_0015318703 /DNA_START=216 /DNA_END=2339 /DNA_ORIENTATION=-